MWGGRGGGEGEGEGERGKGGGKGKGGEGVGVIHMNQVTPEHLLPPPMLSQNGHWGR